MMKKEYMDNIPLDLQGKTEAIVIYNNLYSLPKINFQLPESDTDRVN